MADSSWRLLLLFSSRLLYRQPDAFPFRAVVQQVQDFPFTAARIGHTAHLRIEARQNAAPGVVGRIAGVDADAAEGGHI